MSRYLKTAFPLVTSFSLVLRPKCAKEWLCITGNLRAFKCNFEWYALSTWVLTLELKSLQRHPCYNMHVKEYWISVSHPAPEAPWRSIWAVHRPAEAEGLGHWGAVTSLGADIANAGISSFGREENSNASFRLLLSKLNLLFVSGSRRYGCCIYFWVDVA